MRFRVAAVGFVVASLAASSFAYRNAAWIPPWDGNALTSMQLNVGSLQESNPVWYSMNADGSIAKNWNSENATWRAAMVHADLLPTVQNVVNKSFSGGIVANLIGSATSRDAHAAALLQLVTDNAFDGIDIDYESVPTASRDNFSAFVAVLGQKLHSAGKKLSVTVHAKTSGSDNWTGPGAQDYAAIAQAADSIKIMAYDYHWATSAAGPITPLDWLDKVATYAEANIPAAKIIMGLPWYGYDWTGTSGATVTYQQAMTLARNNGVAVTHDANGEATFSYGGHVVFFQDASADAKKVALLTSRHPSIGGFAHWAAGQEDPDSWKVVRGEVTPATGSSPAAPAAGDFSIIGPSTVTLTQGAQASIEFRLAAINGFSAQTAVSIEGIGALAPQVTPGANSVAPATALPVRVSAASTLPAGTYDFGIRFMSGSLSHVQLVRVTVAAARPARTRAARK